MSALTVAQLSQGYPLPNRKNAFFLQYLSVMLIVLTLIVGTFARDVLQHTPPVQVQAAPHHVKAIAPEVRRAIARVKFIDLFDKDGVQIRSDKLRAIAQLLLSHDVNAEIRINTRGEGISLAYARGRKVIAYLTARGVPITALSLILSRQAGGPQAEVRVYRAADESVAVDRSSTLGIRR